MFRIENFEKGKVDDIEREVCPESMTFLCIQDIDFKKAYFEIQWKKDFFEKSELLLKKDVFKVPIFSELLR